ncbi:hypothetical protein [Streptomyces sp. NPDC096311]|uniref:hypothetical protein n=1 Tax=Streptomyces sp. NPDC096311 TaxID=3366083 RepID=UPI00380DDF60
MARLVGGTARPARLDAVISGLRQAGFTVLRGRATAYEQHIPFQAFTDAFAGAAQGRRD